MRWLDQSDANGSKWFYNGEPCTVMAVGTENTTVEAMRIKTTEGNIVDVHCSAGEFPGVEYESAV